MQLSDEAKLVIQAYAKRFPLPTEPNEAAFQNWTHCLCQQLKYSLPNDGWGHKSASPDRPHSKDCIALQSPFIGWDIILGAGDVGATLSLNGDSIDLTGQFFEPVEAFNHLGIPTEPPVDPPVEPPTEPPVSVEWQTAVLDELKKHTVLLTQIVKGVENGMIEIKKAVEGGIKIRLG